MVNVKHDGEAIPGERCCLCDTRTNFWYTQKDVPLCFKCAQTAKPAAIPSKKEWLESLQDDPVPPPTKVPPLTRCSICKLPTPYWYRDVPLCRPCFRMTPADELPKAKSVTKKTKKKVAQKRVDTHQRRVGVRWGTVLSCVESAQHGLRQARNYAHTDLLDKKNLGTLTRLTEELQGFLNQLYQEEDKVNNPNRRKTG